MRVGCWRRGRFGLNCRISAAGSARSSKIIRSAHVAVLDNIRSPADLRALPAESLKQVTDEVRERILDVVSGHKGAHFGSNLGTVELTVALHRVFDTPRDQLVWDVGHQAYPHKILTGRNQRMDSIRKRSGLSGFLRRDE